jgi:hypothetical protein
MRPEVDVDVGDVADADHIPATGARETVRGHGGKRDG